MFVHPFYIFFVICMTGDITKRLCTASEITFYFDSLFDRGGKTNYLKPNRNCNLSHWANGCEPGWACSVGGNEKVDLKNSKRIPDRTKDCRACCEGFFCPHGITCMIRRFMFYAHVYFPPLVFFFLKKFLLFDYPIKLCLQ